MTRDALLTCLAGTVFVAATVSAAVQTASNRVFVSVEFSGVPARDLKAGEIVVQVDGVERRVRDVQPATGPMSLVIVADAAINDAPYLRAAAGAIVKSLRHGSPTSQVAVLRLATPSVSFIAASAPEAEHTRQISYLSAPTTHSYADGIVEAARALSKTEGPRRVIFVITRKTAPFLETAVAELRNSGASIWGLQIAPVLRPGERHALELAASISGGMADSVIDPAQLPVQATRLVELLLAQCVVTFEAPPDGGRGDLRIGIRRDGARIAAPAWIAR